MARLDWQSGKILAAGIKENTKSTRIRVLKKAAPAPQ
jgi:hypothetical protein